MAEQQRRTDPPHSVQSTEPNGTPARAEGYPYIVPMVGEPPDRALIAGTGLEIWDVYRL